jgi:hypothetical protein
MLPQRKTCAIPISWITPVSAKLKRGSQNEIEWTAQAFRRWQIYGRRGEAYDAMLKALSVSGVVGKRIIMPNDEGETYAFFFTAKGEQMYGKYV